MRKAHLMLALISMLSAPAFATDSAPMDTTTKPCEAIASACLAAGFDRTDTPGKQFWLDCMKPVILGKTVSDVTVDKTTIHTCRMDKIADLKSELKELQKAKS